MRNRDQFVEYGRGSQLQQQSAGGFRRQDWYDQASIRGSVDASSLADNPHIAPSGNRAISLPYSFALASDRGQTEPDQRGKVSSVPPPATELIAPATNAAPNRSHAMREIDSRHSGCSRNLTMPAIEVHFRFLASRFFTSDASFGRRERFRILRIGVGRGLAILLLFAYFS